uniref:Ig-like domain-containing protein n=1 Tax=Anas platyrhynchos TaxID=8839 RepID=A0A8B9ZHB7_ANAPL
RCQLCQETVSLSTTADLSRNGGPAPSLGSLFRCLTAPGGYKGSWLRQGAAPSPQAQLSALPTAQVQASSSQVVGVVGGVVYLSPPPQTQTTTYHQSHWRYGSSLKIAINENGKGVQYPNGPFKDRLELFPNNTLKISSLLKNDSNTYRVYLEDVAGKEDTYRISLKVYDVVPKPTVNATVHGNNPEHCNVTLECWVQMEDVTYEWMPPSRLMPVGSNSTNGTLPLSFNPSLETYTCRASNPVSSSSARLIRRHPCSWTGTGCTRWQNLGEMGGRWLPGVPGVRSLFPWARAPREGDRGAACSSPVVVPLGLLSHLCFPSASS